MTLSLTPRGALHPNEANPFHLAAAEGAVATLSALLKTPLASAFPIRGPGADGRSVLGAVLPFCRGEQGAALIEALLEAGCDPASVEPLSSGAERLRYQGLQSLFDAAEERSGSGPWQTPAAPLGLVALAMDPTAGAALWRALPEAARREVIQAGGLGVAAFAKREDRLREMASLGADLNQPDPAGALPLSRATDAETVCLLLQLGADLSAKDRLGASAMETLMGRQSLGRQEKEMAKVAARWLAPKKKPAPLPGAAPAALSPEQAELCAAAFAALKAGNVEAARYAIQALGPACAQALDPLGKTLFGAAVDAGPAAAPIASLLQRQGCDPFAFNPDGSLPFLTLSARRADEGSYRFDPAFSKVAKALAKSPGVPWARAGADGRSIAELFLGAHSCLGEYLEEIVPQAISAGWSPEREGPDGLNASQRAMLALNSPAGALSLPPGAGGSRDQRARQTLAFLRLHPAERASPACALAFLSALSSSETMARAIGSDPQWLGSPSWGRPDATLMELASLIRSAALHCAQIADLSSWSPSETLRRHCPDFVALLETRALGASAPPAPKASAGALRV